MTSAEHSAAVQALINELSPIVSEASRTVPHTVILSALLSMFRTTALNSPPCTQIASNACMTVGLELAVSHAQELAPAGAPIH